MPTTVRQSLTVPAAAEPHRPYLSNGGKAVVTHVSQLTTHDLSGRGAFIFSAERFCTEAEPAPGRSPGRGRGRKTGGVAERPRTISPLAAPSEPRPFGFD